jgi:hypothetical protein
VERSRAQRDAIRSPTILGIPILIAMGVARSKSVNGRQNLVTWRDPLSSPGLRGACDPHSGRTGNLLAGHDPGLAVGCAVSAPRKSAAFGPFSRLFEYLVANPHFPWQHTAIFSADTRRSRRIHRCCRGAACPHRPHLLLVDTALTSRTQVIPSNQEEPSDKTEMLKKRVLDR